MTPIEIVLAPGADLDGFRQAVRSLIGRGIAPEHVVWSEQTPSLFDGLSDELDEGAPVMLSPAVTETIKTVVCHRHPERYPLLYRLIWRILHGEPRLLDIHSDPLVHRLALMAKAVRRDIHKMHAFLRFREAEPGNNRFVAWFEPEHFILERAARFFADRFRAFDWVIQTPVGTVTWEKGALGFGPPGRRGEIPAADRFEEAWLGYYESVFNPARANPRAMTAEMPKKYWRNMPETRVIPGLLREAATRATAMIEQEVVTSAKRSPDKAIERLAARSPESLATLNQIIASSRPLVPGATQAVLGEGPPDAAVVFVGEQPGDEEDRQGRPFVGPAGEILRRTMREAGIDCSAVYLTNAVKHFKFSQRGKRRIHQKPTLGEVKHYRWWLDEELRLVSPRIVVALGGTAALALTGRSVTVSRERGAITLGGYSGFLTYHPSYLLRLSDERHRKQVEKEFLEDLRAVQAMSACQAR